MVADPSREFVSGNPGRDVQRVGTARFLGQDVAKVHDPVWGVIGTLGDSQCYLGVRSKVDAVHEALAQRVLDDDLPVRLIAPAFTLGVSDGQLNGTDRMRYSLTSRELVNDSTESHLEANDMAGVITVVACDKPPVGTLAALLQHNAPALMLSDGSISNSSIGGSTVGEMRTNCSRAPRRESSAIVACSSRACGPTMTRTSCMTRRSGRRRRARPPASAVIRSISWPLRANAYTAAAVCSSTASATLTLISKDTVRGVSIDSRAILVGFPQDKAGFLHPDASAP